MNAQLVGPYLDWWYHRSRDDLNKYNIGPLMGKTVGGGLALKLFVLPVSDPRKINSIFIINRPISYERDEHDKESTTINVIKHRE